MSNIIPLALWSVLGFVLWIRVTNRWNKEIRKAFVLPPPFWKYMVLIIILWTGHLDGLYMDSLYVEYQQTQDNFNPYLGGIEMKVEYKMILLLFLMPVLAFFIAQCSHAGPYIGARVYYNLNYDYTWGKTKRRGVSRFKEPSGWLGTFELGWRWNPSENVNIDFGYRHESDPSRGSKKEFYNFNAIGVGVDYEWK